MKAARQAEEDRLRLIQIQQESTINPERAQIARASREIGGSDKGEKVYAKERNRSARAEAYVRDVIASGQ